ncbi:hypothetical protein [Qipengyuania sp. ASV99]|uniref:hypothetical protein n=1 Tax=Qipengyuania sp. ASV99 TaxID=3399681 RepID=UPI003A4C7C08
MTNHLCQPVAIALVLSASTLGLATAANAETANSDSQESEFDTDQEAPVVQDHSGWRLEPGLRVTARAVSTGSRIRIEDESVNGNALVFVAIPTLSVVKDDTSVTFSNSVSRYEFDERGRAGRWLNAARLTGRYDLTEDTSISAFGERSDNLFLAEAPSADEWEVGGEVEHHFDDTSRVQLGASWRERSYDDVAKSDGSGPRIDGEYRYRFGANHYAFLRGRYESIDSDTPFRELDRWRAEASYQRPIARDLRLRSELTYQRLSFPGRPLAGGGVREDDLFWPELTLTYSPGAWRISTEARYVVRNSSDPDFDRSGYRLELEVSHAF